MNNRSIRTAAAVLLAASAFAVTACANNSSSASDSSAKPTSQANSNYETGKGGEQTVQGSAPQTTSAPNLPKPTVAELNDKISKAFDPAVASTEKTAWIEDAERDPDLADKLVSAAKKNKVTVEITNVGDPKDGKLKADAKATVDGSPVDNYSVEFVAQGDQWKVSNKFACGIVRTAKLDSAACQASK